MWINFIFDGDVRKPFYSGLLSQRGLMKLKDGSRPTSNFEAVSFTVFTLLFISHISNYCAANLASIYCRPTHWKYLVLRDSLEILCERSASFEAAEKQVGFFHILWNYEMKHCH